MNWVRNGWSKIKRSEETDGKEHSDLDMKIFVHKIREKLKRTSSNLKRFLEKSDCNRLNILK